MKKMDKKAFTLIELIVVVAVVGILVLLGMPRFIGHKDRAELARIQHDVKVMEQEIGTVLINNDDDFNKWENNSKDFNQLIQENRLFEKEGVAKKVESIDKTYKIIPEKHKDKINTKLKGTFYANNDGKVYYEHEKPLLGIPIKPEEKEPEYSDEEIDDLIKNHNFIPVATAEELNNVRNATIETYGKGTQWEDEYTGGLDKQYVQVLNIDLSGYDNWSPIGTESSIFTGTYDGGNYVITGLEVKGEDKNHQGLFGFTEGAAISNVALEDINVTGSNHVGGLVGWAQNSTTISNSYATGSVKGTGDSNAGGLVGYATSSTIKNSYSTGSVEGTSWVGGLVGYAFSSTAISNSYSTGSVEGTGQDIGGLVGSADNSPIENSYSTGSVTGEIYVGGLVGSANNNAEISNSYSTGSVTGSGSWGSVGGLVGSTYKSPIENSYSTGSVEGTVDYVGGLVGSASGSTMISNSYATGSATGSEYVGGLVGNAYELTIENSYATGSVTGSGDWARAGGLMGYIYNSTIENSYATGKVTGSGSWARVGGFVGEAGESTIDNSYATGSVTGSGDWANVGGLVGQDDGSNISNSYWDKETTGQEESAGQAESFGKSTEEMKKQSTYENWSFDTVWEIDEDNDYPKLR